MNFKYMKVNFTLFITLYLSIILFFSIVSYNFFIRDYIKLENKQNQKNINTILSSINGSISSMKSTTDDYSNWDDSYSFIENENSDYIYENFRDGTTTLTDLGVDFFVYSNLKQQTIFSKYTNDLLEKDKVDFEREILRFSGKSTLITLFKHKSQFLFLIKSEIKKSDKTGDTNGYIYSGKLITNKNLNAITKVFKKVYISNRQVSKKYLELKFSHIKNTKVAIDYNSSTLINNIQIFNFNNEYVFSIITENEREILNNGQKTIVIFNLIIAIFVFIILFILYKNQKVLERMVEKKSNEVIEKQKVIAQQSKMIAMAEILENIAHQWRQPLSVITTASSGVKLNKEMGLLTDQDIFESMDTITNSAQYLSNTINDFKNFQNKNKKNVLLCLSKTIEKASSLIDVKFKEQNIKVSHNIQGIKIWGIENELIQVLLNVFNNSIDAFESKELDADNAKLLLIEMQKKDGFIVISIKDNAGGISESIIERIFEPYFTTKHKSQGTGIGLYMSFEIITKHMKGEFFVKNCIFEKDESQYEGAEFTIKLPLSK